MSAAISAFTHIRRFFSDSEEQQHIAGGEKGGIQCGETHQKHHAPEEAIAEVLPLFLLVAALDVEGEAEQQGKDGVCLASKKTENAVEHSLVQHIEPPRGTVGIYRKNEVFQIMNHVYLLSNI